MLVLLDMITLAYDSAYMSRDKKTDACHVNY